MLNNIISLILCILILILYLRIKKYFSFYGFLLLIFFIVTLILNYKNISFNFNKILVPVTVFTVLGFLILVYVGYKNKLLKVHGWFFPLFLTYIIFGMAQQILYQSVFHTSVVNLFGDIYISVLLTSCFILLFHIDKKTNYRLFKLMIIPAFFWSIMFIIQPSVIILGISHGILAAFYYNFEYRKNIIEKELFVSK